jgi:hypothetical protein
MGLQVTDKVDLVLCREQSSRQSYGLHVHRGADGTCERWMNKFQGNGQACIRRPTAAPETGDVPPGSSDI